MRLKILYADEGILIELRLGYYIGGFIGGGNVQWLTNCGSPIRLDSPANVCSVFPSI